MFTGLIETIGILRDTKKFSNKLLAGIEIENFESVKTGDSISCNGVCSTVAKIENNIYYFEYMAETLDKTYFDGLKRNQKVNIERALISNGRFDGHFVQGHVDEVGKIKNIYKKNNNISFQISYSSKFDNYIIKKGSIAVDGVSLTVADVKKESFKVSLISHTFENTNFKNKNIGDPVNLEYDLIGKYLHKFYQNSKNENSSNIREVLKEW
ncbi:MAG: riboflavin synthase [Candidatus Mcinerneyibacterium aminivorans]|jgi:riboflavin synthase|uniref:Riboflavin synthase n=1 Tax=Candidatus Mcinerneyibacterium aminivorans TaxID=2703815 RepID=A0A5D0MFZ0_9BACT|nr:MAG: riboflavin synthase [Candidatus Mcinerneyibacterium aminivorans]